MRCPPSSRAAGREGAQGSVRGRDQNGEALSWVLQRVNTVRQPTRPCSPPSCPSFCPCPQAPTYMYGPGRGQACSEGWVGLGVPTPQPGHPLRGCCRPQRINGAEAIHFLWLGDRPHHTAPIVGHPYLRKFRCPIRRRQPAPHAPGLAFPCLLEAGELGRPGSRVMWLLMRVSHPWEVWGTREGGARQGLGSSGFQKAGPGEVKEGIETEGRRKWSKEAQCTGSPVHRHRVVLGAVGARLFPFCEPALEEGTQPCPSRPLCLKASSRCWHPLQGAAWALSSSSSSSSLFPYSSGSPPRLPQPLCFT